MGERNEGKSWDKLFFSASSQLMSLWEGEKNSFMHETVWEMSVWQIKQLTTAHEVAVSCVKQTLNEIRNSHAATNPRWVERVYYKLRCPGVFIVHCIQTLANPGAKFFYRCPYWELSLELQNGDYARVCSSGCWGNCCWSFCLLLSGMLDCMPL